MDWKAQAQFSGKKFAETLIRLFVAMPNRSSISSFLWLGTVADFDLKSDRIDIFWSKFQKYSRVMKF